MTVRAKCTLVGLCLAVFCTLPAQAALLHVTSGEARSGEQSLFDGSADVAGNGFTLFSFSPFPLVPFHGNAFLDLTTVVLTIGGVPQPPPDDARFQLFHEPVSSALARTQTVAVPFFMTGTWTVDDVVIHQFFGEGTLRVFAGPPLEDGFAPLIVRYEFAVPESTTLALLGIALVMLARVGAHRHISSRLRP